MVSQTDFDTQTTTGGAPTVLVYTPGIHGYFDEESDAYVGGREQQYSQFVPRLQRAGLNVHAVVYNAPDHRTDVTYHEIRHPSAREFAHLSFLRDITTVFSRSDPDIVLQCGSQASTYIFRILSGLQGVPFVFHWATDADLTGEKVPPKHIGPLLFRVCRERADLNIVQTKQQADLINEPAVIIPNIMDTRLEWKQASGDQVLWLATIAPPKSPHRFFELARSLPQRQFRMAGKLFGPEEFKTRIAREIERTENVEHLGGIPRQQVPAFLSTGRCLVNTSDYEGFSNTYLEAAASQLPIVSLSHDPNDIIEQHDAGIVVDKSSADLSTAVESMFDDATWEKYREGCKQITSNHQPEPIVESLYTTLSDLVGGLPSEISQTEMATTK